MPEAVRYIQLSGTVERTPCRPRESVYHRLWGCKGKLDIEKIRAMGIKGIKNISGAEIEDEAETLTIDTIYGEKTCAYTDAMLERCHVCKGKDHMIFDEIIGESKETKDADRFAEVEKIEAMSPEEKFAFFQKELSKCIRCNACRNVCPACSCRKCVFDSNKFDSSQKANRGFLRGEDVPYHPRLPCGRKMYGLRRVQQSMSAGHPPASLQPQVVSKISTSSTASIRPGRTWSPGLR